MPTHSNRGSFSRKPVYIASLRRLGTALNNPSLGLALRGTSLEEARNRKKNRPSTKVGYGGLIYAYQPALGEESNRTTLTKLRGSIIATVRYALKGRNVISWRKWKHSSDYPAVIILKNKKKKGMSRYRGGSYEVGPTDMRKTLFVGGTVVSLEIFEKTTHHHIPPKDVAAIVRLTKKEIQEAEAKVKKKYGTNYETMLTFECLRIMTNKTAQAIAKAYRKELVHPTKA